MNKKQNISWKFNLTLEKVKDLRYVNKSWFNSVCEWLSEVTWS